MALTKINSRSATSLDATILSGIAPTATRQLGTAEISLGSGTFPKTLTVPSGCNNFTVSVVDWSWAGSGNPDFGFHLGSGGTLKTSGYEGQIAYIYNQGNDSNDREDTKIRAFGNWGAATKFSGLYQFHNVTGNTWVITCESFADNGVYASGAIVWGPARITLDGECDIVGLVDFTGTSGVTCDSGHMRAYFY